MDKIIEEQFLVTYEKKKRIVLKQGDIFQDEKNAEKKADVLLCSAFSGSYLPSENTLIGGLNK